MLGFCLVQLLSWSCVGGFLQVVYGVVFELVSGVGCLVVYVFLEIT